MLTPDNYHADITRISKSGLDLISQAPAKYFQKYLVPDGRDIRQESATFRIGRAFHRATTEPGTFFQHYAVHPGRIDRRTTEGRDRWAEFETSAEGKTILQAEPDANGKDRRALDYNTIMRMRDSVYAHPSASHLLRIGVPEKIITWEDSSTGAQCKSMLDFLPPVDFIVDLKSTDDASPDGFRRSIIRYRYDVQAAFYLDGAYNAISPAQRAFIFVAVEKKPPYLVACYALDTDSIDRAREKYTADLSTYMDCRKSGCWPGYSHKINFLYI